MIGDLFVHPQLKADNTSSDFPNITYVNNATLGDDRALVVNELRGERSEILSRMVEDRKIAWIIEIRSPATLYSKTIRSFQTETSIQWNSEETGEKLPVYIISQLVALEEVYLPAEILHELWRTRPFVRAPAGAVLAQGNVQAAKPLIASILRFIPDETLSDGTIEVSGPDEHIRFTVKTAVNLHLEIRTRRDILLGALIAAMGKLKPEDHDPEDSRVLRSISQRLAEGGVEDWMHDGYNPALAATTLEPFLSESAEPE